MRSYRVETGGKTSGVESTGSVQDVMTSLYGNWKFDGIHDEGKQLQGTDLQAELMRKINEDVSGNWMGSRTDDDVSPKAGDVGRKDRPPYISLRDVVRAKEQAPPVSTVAASYSKGPNVFRTPSPTAPARHMHAYGHVGDKAVAVNIDGMPRVGVGYGRDDQSTGRVPRASTAVAPTRRELFSRSRDVDMVEQARVKAEQDAADARQDADAARQDAAAARHLLTQIIQGKVKLPTLGNPDGTMSIGATSNYNDDTSSDTSSWSPRSSVGGDGGSDGMLVLRDDQRKRQGKRTELNMTVVTQATKLVPDLEGRANWRAFCDGMLMVADTWDLPNNIMDENAETYERGNFEDYHTIRARKLAFHVIMMKCAKYLHGDVAVFLHDKSNINNAQALWRYMFTLYGIDNQRGDTRKAGIQLRSCTQQSLGLNISAYAVEFLRREKVLIDMRSPTTTKDLIEFFMDGLGAVHKERVHDVQQAREDPNNKSFQTLEAVMTYFKLKAAKGGYLNDVPRSQSGPNSKFQMSQEVGLPSNEGELKRLNEEIKKLQMLVNTTAAGTSGRNTSGRKSGTSTQVTCSKCYCRGHSADKCDGRSSKVTCTLCETLGHVRHNCPRLKDKEIVAMTMQVVELEMDSELDLDSDMEIVYHGHGGVPQRMCTQAHDQSNTIHADATFKLDCQTVMIQDVSEPETFNVVLPPDAAAMSTTGGDGRPTMTDQQDTLNVVLPTAATAVSTTGGDGRPTMEDTFNVVLPPAAIATSTTGEDGRPTMMTDQQDRIFRRMTVELLAWFVPVKSSNAEYHCSSRFESKRKYYYSQRFQRPWMPGGLSDTLNTDIASKLTTLAGPSAFINLYDPVIQRFRRPWKRLRAKANVLRSRKSRVLLEAQGRRFPWPAVPRFRGVKIPKTNHHEAVTVVIKVTDGVSRQGSRLYSWKSRAWRSCSLTKIVPEVWQVGSRARQTTGLGDSQSTILEKQDCDRKTKWDFQMMQIHRQRFKLVLEELTRCRPERYVVHGSQRRRRKLRKANHRHWKSRGFLRTMATLAATDRAIVQAINQLNSSAVLEDREEQVCLDSGAQVNSVTGGHPSNKVFDAKEVTNMSCSGVAAGASVKITKVGSWMPVSATDELSVVIKKTYEIPGTTHNLLSVGKLDDKGCKIVFENGEAHVWAKDRKNLLFYAKKVNGLYYLRKKVVAHTVHVATTQLATNMTNYDTSTLMRYHEVLGHRAFSTVRKLMGMPPSNRGCLDPVCQSCLEAEMKGGKGPIEALSVAPRPGFRLCTDVSKKMAATNIDGIKGAQRFWLTVDEFSNTIYESFGQRKSCCYNNMEQLIDRMNSQISPHKVAEHQTDGGKELVGKKMIKIMESRGVTPRNSAPYCQYQNGVAESAMHLIQTKAKAMLFRGQAQDRDWPYAIRHAVNLHNILPNIESGLSPYEKRTGLPPRETPQSLDGTLFCECMAKLYNGKRWEKQAVKCIYLGKDPRSPASLVRVIGGKVSGRDERVAQVVSFNISRYPYAEGMIPRPEEIKSQDYASDTDCEEEIEARDSDNEDDSDGQENDDNSTSVPLEEEIDEKHGGASDGSDDHDEKCEAKDTEIEDEPNVFKMADGWVPDDSNQIDGEEAWTIKAIKDDRVMKFGKGKIKRTRKEYLVAWEGDWEDQWIPARQMKAPDLLKGYLERKRPVAVQGITKVVQQMMFQVNQLNGEVEYMLKEEPIIANPFRSLFDPNSDTRVPPPKGYQSMRKHIHAKYYMEASIREKMENLKWQAYVEVPRSSVPTGTKILRPVTVYDTKYNARGEIEKFKVRVCLNGSKTQVDPSDTYEHVCGSANVRMLLCLAARYKMHVVQTDVKNFFLQARLPEDIEYYTEIPDGWAENDPKTHVAKVLAPWYGLKESAKLAGDQLAAIYEKAGLKKNPWMPRVFSMWDGDDYIAVGNHIDDAAWIATNLDKLNKVLDKIELEFELTRTYKPTKLLGCEIDYDQERGIMKFHQTSYNQAKTMESGRNHKSVSSPGYIPSKLQNPLFENHQEQQATEERVREFQKRIGIHMWGNQSDPASTFTVQRLATKMLNPQPEDWIALNRIDDYKATNPGIGVVWRAKNGDSRLKKNENLDCLTFFADADLSDGRSSGKSTTGYSVFMGESGMFDWKVKRQTCVSQSSCESEVTCSKDATCHAIWLRNGLSFMGFTFGKPTPVCQDNQSAIALCHSDKHHSRTRHFRLHVNLLRDCFVKRITCYPWIPTKYMKGDLFNKCHGPARHMELMEMNGISHLPLSELSNVAKPLKIYEWLHERSIENAAKKSTRK